MPLVTESDLVDYRAMLSEIAELAQGDLEALLALLEEFTASGGEADVFAAVNEIIRTYRELAVDAATDFYAAQGLGTSLSDSALASTPAQDMRRRVRFALYGVDDVEQQASLLSGLVQMYVVDGARALGFAGIARQGQRWVRAAHPGACQFCRMLALSALHSTGGYSSQAAASIVGAGLRGRGKRAKAPRGGGFHPHCMCVPVLADAYEPPEYVRAWQADYRKATSELGGSGSTKQILSTMRTVSGHRH